MGSDEVQKNWFEGKLFWINHDLYVVTKLGEKIDGTGWIPVKVEKVDF